MQYVSRITMWYGEASTATHENMGDDITDWLDDIIDDAKANHGEAIRGTMSAVVFKVEVLLNDPSEADEFESDYDSELFSSPDDDDLVYFVYPDGNLDLFTATYSVTYSPDGTWVASVAIKPGDDREVVTEDLFDVTVLFHSAMSERLDDDYTMYYNAALEFAVDTTAYDVETM